MHHSKTRKSNEFKSNNSSGFEIKSVISDSLKRER